MQNVSTTEGSAEKSVISVWNLFMAAKSAEKVLISRSHITCAECDDNSSLIVAAMIDGSLSLWDLNEESHNHREKIIDDNNKYILRLPSYNTAGTELGHNCRVNDINRITYKDDYNANQFHFATVDENGLIVIWSAKEANGMRIYNFN